MKYEPDYDRLIDPRLGLIKALQRIDIPAELPAAYISYRADVANTRHFVDIANTRHISLWHADRTALGAAFYHEEQARKAAIGEAVERYCGNFVPAAGLRRASYAELCATGEPALNPEELVLYSSSQYAHVASHLSL